MTNDSIADTLIQIKNGYMAKKDFVLIPYTKFCEQLIKLIVNNGFAQSYRLESKGHLKRIKVELKYDNKKPAITKVIRVSKSSLRVYANKNSIPNVFGGLGITIVSTPVGLLTGSQARQQKIGGEIICKIW